jgi:hypothetical protein
MYKEFFDPGEIWDNVLSAKSVELCPSHLEPIVLPAVFHTKEDKILKENKVDATMANRLFSRDPIHFRNMQDHHLM